MVERAGFENRCTVCSVPRVRIPPPPLQRNGSIVLWFTIWAF